MGAARSHQWTGHTRDAAARDRGTPCSALGRDVSPAQGRPSSDLHGPPAAIHKRRQGATPEYVQWARTAPHVITHIATLSGADPRRQRRAVARETHRTTPHTHHTDLLLVWNEAARAQLGGAPRSTRWWQPARAYTGSVKEPAVTTHPTHPPPAGGATATRGGNQAVQAGRARRPMHAAWNRMEHALMPLPPCSPPRPPVPRHMDNITFTDASRLRVTPRHQTRHRTCSLAQQPGSTSTVAPTVTLIPGTRQAETPSTTGAGSAPTTSGIAPDAAHHRNRLLVCALSNTQGRAPPALVRMHRHAEILGRIRGCTRGWHRVWNH
jgi:hypothetical protein